MNSKLLLTICCVAFVAAATTVTAVPTITLAGLPQGGEYPLLLNADTSSFSYSGFYHFQSDTIATAPIEVQRRCTFVPSAGYNTTLNEVTQWVVGSNFSLMTSLGVITSYRLVDCSWSMKTTLQGRDQTFDSAILPPPTQFRIVLAVPTTTQVNIVSPQPSTSRSNECIFAPSPIAANGYLSSYTWGSTVGELRSIQKQVTFGIWRSNGDGGLALVSKETVTLVYANYYNAGVDTPVLAGDRVGACYTGNSPFPETSSNNYVTYERWTWDGTPLQIGTNAGSLTNVTSRATNFGAWTSPMIPIPRISSSWSPYNGGSDVRITSTRSVAASSSLLIRWDCWAPSATNRGSSYFWRGPDFLFTSAQNTPTGALSSFIRFNPPTPDLALGMVSCIPTVQTASPSRDASFDYVQYGDNGSGGAASFSLVVAAPIKFEQGQVSRLVVGDGPRPLQLNMGLAKPLTGPVEISFTCGSLVDLVFTFSVGSNVSDVQQWPTILPNMTAIYSCISSVRKTNPSRDTLFDNNVIALQASVEVIALPAVTIQFGIPTTVLDDGSYFVKRSYEQLSLRVGSSINTLVSSGGVHCSIVCSQGSIPPTTMTFDIPSGGNISPYQFFNTPHTSSMNTTFDCVFSVNNVTNPRDSSFDRATPLPKAMFRVVSESAVPAQPSSSSSSGGANQASSTQGTSTSSPALSSSAALSSTSSASASSSGGGGGGDNSGGQTQLPRSSSTAATSPTSSTSTSSTSSTGTNNNNGSTGNNNNGGSSTADALNGSTGNGGGSTGVSCVGSSCVNSGVSRDSMLSFHMSMLLMTVLVIFAAY